MIIIRGENNEYRLYNVTHTYVNITSYTNPSNISDCVTYFKSAKMKELYGLEIDIEIDLDLIYDFKVVERIPQQLQDNGLIYDTVYVRPISIKLDRKEKLEKLESICEQ